MLKHLTLYAAAGAMAAACSPADLPEREPTRGELIGQGQAMAEMMCADCHAIGADDVGPHPETVPFGRLSWKYPIETLAEPLAEGIIVGHPDMPVFQFEPKDIDALLAYLKTIQEPQPT